MRKILNEFILLVLFLTPLCFFMGIGSLYGEQGNEKWIHFFGYAIVCFSIGVKWTKSYWIFIGKEIEREVKSEILGDTRIADMLDELCESVGCKKMGAFVIESEVTWAAIKKGRPLSRMNSVLFISKKCEQLDDDELRALLAHEIAHVAHGDGLLKDTIRQIIGNCVCFGFLIIMVSIIEWPACIPIIGIFFGFLGLVFLLFFGLGIVIYNLIDARRYWNQIREIRADRVACTYLGVTTEGMLKLLRRLQSEQNKDYSWNERIYNQYYAFVSHPCLERRIELIEKYRTWSLWDYFRHVIQMCKWFVTGKGWAG